MLAYMRELAENAPSEPPVQLGIEDIDQWELMLLHLPDAALDRIIQSFPEFEDAPASLIRLVIAEVDQRSRHRRAGKPPSSNQN